MNIKHKNIVLLGFQSSFCNYLLKLLHQEGCSISIVSFNDENLSYTIPLSINNYTIVNYKNKTVKQYIDKADIVINTLLAPTCKFFSKSLKKQIVEYQKFLENNLNKDKILLNIVSSISSEKNKSSVVDLIQYTKENYKKSTYIYSPFILSSSDSVFENLYNSASHYKCVPNIDPNTSISFISEKKLIDCTLSIIDEIEHKLLKDIHIGNSYIKYKEIIEIYEDFLPHKVKYVSSKIIKLKYLLSISYNCSYFEFINNKNIDNKSLKDGSLCYKKECFKSLFIKYLSCNQFKFNEQAS